MREIDKKRLKKFGARLKKLRKEKGLSLRELAAQCDVDFSKISKLEKNTVSKLEKDMVNLTLTTLIELANGLEVPLKELLDIDFE